VQRVCKPSAGAAILNDDMRFPALVMVFSLLAAVGTTTAQSGKPAPKKSTPAAKKPPQKKGSGTPVTRVQATLTCPSELGVGVKTSRRFCDVLAGRQASEGVLVAIPPHRGPVTLSFELHNRHTYSEELIKEKTAYRRYTATVGVLSMDDTLIERAVVFGEFRTAGDLLDRIRGGAGAGNVKAVAPMGSEFITIELPETIGEQVSILGERLTVVRPDGVDNFVSAGRPVATISNVMVEYRPGPPPRKQPAKKP
jgi:hypothetical protein